ncbi:hypothetical protein EJ04DRAFT_511628 [Polyplosphaeria fusca]|uniref:Opioid growth factor receptor (OGFr) conserved domain-containing protein n=1 Tax=Polyplosphaeria fusca TaxID=682080 RepID=A0A9P4R2T6_9PLEO|nr:hypothetical protein EJ04DRAFT_511628 [Polyplosphaeria fusca]
MGPSEDSDKHILRAARTSFFNYVLKRPKPQSIPYEATTAQPVGLFNIGDDFTMVPNKRQISASPDGSDLKPSKKTPLLIRFYDGQINAADAANRTLDDILGWSDQRLEQCHDYIQMLFPLPEGSPYNYQAPIIDREIFQAFRSRPELQDRLRESFIRILDFYGFEAFVEVAGDRAKTDLDTADVQDANEKASKEEPTTEAKEEGVDSSGLVEQTSTSPEVSDPPGPPQALDISPPIPLDGKDQAKVEILHPATSGSNEKGDNDVSTKVLKAENETQSNTSGPNEAAPDDILALSDSGGDEMSIEGFYYPTRTASGLVTGLVIVRAQHWQVAFRNWAIRFDHNHLRITRILRCLRVLGLQEECDAFYRALVKTFNDPRIQISERTMLFWRKAVENPLWIAPANEQVVWLRKWEEAQGEDSVELGGVKDEEG